MPTTTEPATRKLLGGIALAGGVLIMLWALFQAGISQYGTSVSQICFDSEPAGVTESMGDNPLYSADYLYIPSFGVECVWYGEILETFRDFRPNGPLTVVAYVGLASVAAGLILFSLRRRATGRGSLPVEN